MDCAKTETRTSSPPGRPPHRRSRTLRRQSARLASGFTLIELMVVVVIMGFIAGWTLADYSGITDEQRLHSAVREFVGVYRSARSYAAKERRQSVLQYDMKRRAYRLLVYPWRDDTGHYVDAAGELLDQETEDERVANVKWKFLEKDVFLAEIEAPGASGNEKFEQDYFVEFRQDGTIPPHILHFVSRKGLRMSLEIEEITGTVTVKEGHTAFYSPREDEFNMMGGGTLGK
jgi:prepilin-type N-terminal cleavage/methylation domain-containing protein